MVNSEFTLADYRAAADAVRARTSVHPQVGLILGSGLATLAQHVEHSDVIDSREIPRYPQTAVQGHSNKLVFGKLEGKAVMVATGRPHFYEGHTMAAATFPVRLMQMLGVKLLIVTNAAGGLNPDFRAGDVMLISDHINFPGMAGHHPLIGPNDEALGPRFPDMTNAYDRDLREMAQQVARERGITLREGVYLGLSGPSFETPAEVKMQRMLGADSVGMSTVHEVVVARHGGMKVLGFSGISNMLVQDVIVETTHEEVLAMGANKITPEITTIIRGVLAKLSF